MMVDVESGDAETSAPDSAAALSEAIGTRVRRERNALNLTLDQLAERSDVSRRMLINIEKGEANPSMAILLRVGDALGVGLPALVESPRFVPYRVIRSGTGTTLWKGDQGGTGILVAGTRAPNVIELWQWTLEPGERHSSTMHNAGAIELLHVHEGQISVTIANQKIDLSQDDAVEFDGDRSHSYANNGDTPSVFSMVVYEPVSPAGQSTAERSQ